MNFYINISKHQYDLITDDVRFIIHNDKILAAVELNDLMIKSTSGLLSLIKLIAFEMKITFLNELYEELKTIFHYDFSKSFQFVRYYQKSNVMYFRLI